ncbi:MAG: hypothetical protein H6Q89_5420 [Myxococcaceae bacterium]|nr:hypothetical protein [Myxococcaceae bacterium]
MGKRPSPLSRRRFLLVGGVTGALLAVGGVLVARGGGRTHYRALAPPGVRPLVFSDKAFGVLCALCDRILPAKDPADPSRPDAREARIAERIDQELTFHTPRMQRDVELALLFLEHGGLLHFSTTRFTRLSPEDQDALLQKMIEGVQVEQQAINAIKLLALFFYYADDRTWNGIHYAGPQGIKRKRPLADSSPRAS